MDPVTAVTSFMDTAYNLSTSRGDPRRQGSLSLGQYLNWATNPNGYNSLEQNAARFNGSDAVHQFNAQRYDNWNNMQIRVRDALKAGINPAAVVGMSSGHYSPTISLNGDSQNQSGYSGFNNFLSGLFNRQARQDRAIALESAELDLEYKRLQNDILRQQLLSASQPGIVSSNGDQPKNSSWRIPMDYRLRDLGELYLPWRDRSGNIHWFLNPDAIADADWSNIEADRALLAGVRDLSYDYVPRDGSLFKRYWPKFRRFVRSKVGVKD